MKSTGIFLLAMFCGAQSLAGGGDINIGINGESCSFASISSAISTAPDGSTIYLAPDFYSQVLGVIDKSLTFVPSLAGSNCQSEDLLANRNLYSVSAQGLSQGETGGLVEITDGAQVTFRNMVLRDATATNGGIIAVTNGASLTLDGAIVRDGEATAAGGNIYATGSGSVPSEISLINGAFIHSGESGTDGGGIALFGSVLTVQNATIGGDGAGDQNASGGNGGGIAAFLSAVSLDSASSRLVGNVSENAGGGLFALDSSVSITGASVSNNFAESDGGGIRLAGGDLTVTDSMMTGNILPEDAFQDFPLLISSRGGAIFATGATVTIDNSAITLNRAGSGGGVGGGEGSALIIQNGSLLSQNTASFRGGGVWAAGPLVVRDSDITSNLAIRSGGGIECGSASLTNIRVSDNESQYGGGVRFFAEAGAAVRPAIIENAVFESNRGRVFGPTQTSGGAIRLRGVSLTVSNTEFRLNEVRSAFASGGAISAFPAEQEDLRSLTISSSTFTQNAVSSALASSGTGFGGGALSIARGNSLVLYDTLFDRNRAEPEGGALNLSGAETIAKNVRLRANNATDTGGAIYARGGSIEFVSDFQTCNQGALPANQYCASITSNTAESAGGVYLADVTGTFTQMAFIENYSNNDATAMHVVNTSNVAVENVLFAHNDEGAFSVGVVNLSNETSAGGPFVAIRASSIVDNIGTAIVADSLTGQLSVENSIIHDNTAGPSVSPSTDLQEFCNNSQLPYQSDIRIGDNLGSPAFDLNNPRGDYRLTQFSPSVDRCPDGPATDLDGLFRDNAGSAFDQGAFEFEGLLVRPDLLFDDSFE